MRGVIEMNDDERNEIRAQIIAEISEVKSEIESLKELTKPIPPDNAKVPREDVDLMWLGGYRTDAHAVYFGRDRKAVEKIIADWQPSL